VVRGALLSVVVCLAGSASLCAAGWSLQTLTLPPPARGARVAADVSTWLHEYRYSIDIFHSRGHRLRGACLHGWYPQRRNARRFARGSLVVLDGGPVVLDTGSRRYVRFLSGRQRRDLPVYLAVATGCTSSLSASLYAAVHQDKSPRVERAYAANQPALALHAQLHDERLTIYVSPRSYRPLVVIATVGGRTATARIYLVRAGWQVRAHYRRLLAELGIRSA